MTVEALWRALNGVLLVSPRVGCQLKNNRPYCAKHDSLNVIATMTTMVVLRHEGLSTLKVCSGEMNLILELEN